MFDYGNFEFAILQAIIERVSGMPYEQYLLSQVFNPVGITAPRLFHISPYGPATGEAKHYKANGDYAEYAAANTCDNLPPNVGAGGWAMSAKDLLRYLTGVDGFPLPDILSAPERAAMLHSPQQDDPANAAIDPVTPGLYNRNVVLIPDR